MSDPNPDFGDQVTYIDSDGEEFYAVVLEPLPDDSYITLAMTDEDPREGYVGPRWTVETSVYPHRDTCHEHASDTHAYRPGW